MYLFIIIIIVIYIYIPFCGAKNTQTITFAEE